MARIRAVLFDIDGTLLDSNDAQAHAWLDAFRGHGKNLPYDHLRSRIGMGGDLLLRELLDIDPESIEGRSITERRTAILKAHYLPDLGPLPGARALVDRVRSRGLVCVAATSARAEELADLLRAAAVADLMDVTVTADDVDRSKPDPQIVEVALQRLQLQPQEAVLVGDSPYDVEAGRAAGVAVVALRSGGYRDADLEGAVAIYDGPADLVSRVDESPLFRGLDEAELRAAARLSRGRRVATSSR